MGSVLCCLGVDNSEEQEHRNEALCGFCICLRCFTQCCLNATEQDVAPSSHQLSAPLAPASVESNSCSPLRPLAYDDPRCSVYNKASEHLHGVSRSCRHQDIDDRQSTAAKSSGLKYDGRFMECCSDSEAIYSTSAEKTSGASHICSTSEDEEVCPTCLEEYTAENPRITMQCTHQFHLSCIYEWMQRSETCPVCGRITDCEEKFKSTRKYIELENVGVENTISVSFHVFD